MGEKKSVEREFDDFARKIARLESLKHELDAMDTGGFEAEAKAIRSKLKDINSIPEIERGISALRKKIGGKPEYVDKKVGSLVDAKYNEFVSGIKEELSEKLRKKERAADHKLKSGLEKQKREFEEKYIKLNDDFHKKYRQKVDEELQNEVRARFDGLLKSRLDAERKKITDMIIADYAKRLKGDREKIKEEIDEAKKRMLEALSSRSEEIRKKSADGLRAKQDKIRKEIEKEYKERLKRETEKKEKELEKKKKELENHIVQHAKELFE
jgi:hypothetical protein